MTRASRAVTVIVQPDGTTSSQTYRVPLWLLRAGLGFMAAAAVAAVVVAALYGPLLRAAARVPGLEHRVAAFACMWKPSRTGCATWSAIKRGCAGSWRTR